MDVSYENETINEFFAKDDIPAISFDQLERYLHEDNASLNLTESSNSATGTPYSQSVASTPVIQTRQPHPAQSLSASATAVNTLTSSLGRHPHGFDNHGFVTDVQNGGYQEVSPRLPDSPPDSGSEAFSPPENKDVGALPTGYLPPAVSSGHAIDHHGRMLGPVPGYHTGAVEFANGHPQGILSVSGVVPQGVPCMQLPVVQGMDRLPPQYAPSVTMATEDNFQRAPSFSTSHRHKKRKHSLSPESTVNQALLKSMGINIKQEPVGPGDPCAGVGPSNQCAVGPSNQCAVGSSNPCTSVGPSFPSQQAPGDQFEQLQGGDGMAYTNTIYQSLKWQPYEQQKWHKLYDCNYKELSQLTFRVEADKGFNFAVPDDAFVCQKKNHFQVTVHIGVTATPVYVKTDTGATAPVKSFKLHLRGIKVEAINSNIRVEQSQADRTKKEFAPINMDLRVNEITKATVGRLHFSETTSNNMRKKGKPNPDQRYFMLVVGIHAYTEGGHFPIAQHVSERIIVRASNPGQFESEMDIMWQRGGVPDSIHHAGNVGIKTETPDEALTVHGNIRVTGHIVQPSDKRAKEDFRVLDPSEQLKNIERMKIMQYKYKEAFAEYAGLPECDRGVETGVVAQELQEILPDAVYATGDVELPTGENIDQFLVVNKDRIYMESVGAVKELCRLNNKLETRINEIEKVNRKLAKLKRLDSLKSTSSGTLSRNGSSRSRASVMSKGRKHQSWPTGTAYLSPRAMQCTMVLLIFIMFFCVITMAVLLVLQFNPAAVSSESPTDTGSTEGFNNRTNASTMTSSTPEWASMPQGTTLPSSCGYDNCEQFCCDVYTPTTTPPSSFIHPQDSEPVTGIQGGEEPIPPPLEQSTTKEPFVPDPGDPGLAPMDPKDPKMNKSTTLASSNHTVEEAEMPEMPNLDDDIAKQVQVDPPSSRRRKRASDGDGTTKGGEAAPMTELDIISIWSSVLDTKERSGNVTDMDYCKKPCGGSDRRNFTYEIPVSVYIREETTNLIVSTDKNTKSRLCTSSQSLDRLCTRENISIDEDKTSEARVQQGPDHSWDLPIKSYVNNTYTIRWFHVDTDMEPCLPDANLNQVKEYTFIFYRNMAECIG